MRRPLRESDFKEYGIFGDMINATYTGNSRYLINGEEYIVTKSNRKNKVTVKLSYNSKLKTSNGGVEFSINTFEIEVEDEKKMVSLDDLSPEGKERLLQEAREIVDKENIERNARAMYVIKKRDLVDDTINEMADIFKLKAGPEVTRLRDRFINITNYLYSINTKQKGNIKITTKEEWELYVDISNKVHECMIHCVKYNNIKK